MRKLNLSLMSSIGVLALCLTLIAIPTIEARELSHWALVVGVFSSATAISVLYAIAAFIPHAEHKKSHSVILVTYFLALIIGTITGGFWGVVGHVMETEKLDFSAAFGYVMPLIYGGYSLAALILCGALVYSIKHRKHNSSIASGV